MNVNPSDITGTAQLEAWHQRVLPPIEQVRPGLWSFAVPIPFSPLRYTLCYAFVSDTGGDSGGSTGVVLVDPGWDTSDGRDAVTAGLAAAGARLRDVTGVVVTHIHPDHHGLSGWLRQVSGAWIAMHPAEADSLPGRLWHDRSSGVDLDWLRGHGVPDEEIGKLVVHFEDVAEILELAEPDRYVQDGDQLPIPDWDVRAVWTPGHTPGHLCLHDAGSGVLLTGDHLLPRITPNIGVHSGADGDPLTGYLASLERTTIYQSDEALPAHEYRFRDIAGRAKALLTHHERRGAEILAAVDRLAQPTAWAIATQLTWSRGWEAVHDIMRRMALAETVAHLHHLVTIGELAPATGTPLIWRRKPRP